MKKSKRLRLILGAATAVLLCAAAALYCFRTPTAGITRAQLEPLIRQSLVAKATLTPTPYPGVYQVEGQARSGGALKDFNVTAHLEPEELKRLLANPEVNLEVPGVGAKGQWFGIGATLALLGLVTGSVAYQSNVGRGKDTRVRQRPNVRFSDVAGVDEAKAEVREVVDFLREPEKFRRLGGTLPKGILLVGPPGTGKTMLAKAIAGEADASFFSAHGSDFNEVFVGVGAKRIRQLFKQAARHKPAILFIDEIDCVGKQRKMDTHGEHQQTINALLAAMDGFEGGEGVVVLAATNRPEDLDDALTRPGRFDRKVYVPHPDLKGRRAILGTHAKDKPLADESALDVIAQTTPGLSGADLANLLNEAAILCAQQNREDIAIEQLEAARDKVHYGLERKSMVLTQRERELIAFHEAGHALVNLQKDLLPPLYKVSIVPRGQALGVTTLLPTEDQNIHGRNYILQQLVLLMGGRAAERTFYGVTTNGASGDLNAARNLARRMIHDWGMGEKLYYEPQQRDAEREINRLLEDADREALEILQSRKTQAERLARALLARETLTRAEVIELLESPEPRASEVAAAS